VRYRLILLLLIAMPCWSQTTTTGKATTTGTCSPAVTGSNNQFRINCRGVSKDDLTALLKQNQGNVKVTLAKIAECNQEIKLLGEQQANRFDELLSRSNAIFDAIEVSNLTPQKLLAKYPVGYIIFDVNYQNEVFPYQSRGFLEKHRVDWSNVRIVERDCPLTQESLRCFPIMVRLPDFAGFRNVAVGGPKQVGPIGPTPAAVVDFIAMEVEILAIRPDGIVFLIGFRNL
jgi:hypothetical protein